MAALVAGRRGRAVLLLDHGERPGRKILISGGGRCNFTNLGTRAENFLSDNPHFARSALAGYTPQDFVALVEQHGIRYHEKTLGQLFCDDTAHRIVRMLESECGAAGVRTACGVRLMGLSRDGAGFALETSSGSLSCSSVVVATGGLSIPKLGATGWGYELARQFGHSLVEPRPALVPLTFSAEDTADWCDLSGISCEVSARASAAPGKGRNRRAPEPPAFREKLLITHRGLSGPAVLQVSSYWRPGGTLEVDLAPGGDATALLRERQSRRDRTALRSALRSILPARLGDRWTELHLRRGEDWTNAGLEKTESALHRWTVRPEGTEGFAKAEVTAGGVDTRELDARTLQSLRAPGLFFVGEVVDVTGWLGGYNFQWAWASGVAAGRVA